MKKAQKPWRLLASPRQGFVIAARHLKPSTDARRGSVLFPLEAVNKEGDTKKAGTPSHWPRSDHDASGA